MLLAGAFARRLRLGHPIPHIGLDLVEIEACAPLHRRDPMCNLIPSGSELNRKNDNIGFREFFAVPSPYRPRFFASLYSAVALNVRAFGVAVEIGPNGWPSDNSPFQFEASRRGPDPKRYWRLAGSRHSRMRWIRTLYKRPAYANDCQFQAGLSARHHSAFRFRHFTRGFA